MQIIVSSEARNDITNIYSYIAADSVKYANKTVSNIYSRIAELETSPYIGRYVPEFPDKQYRELLYKNYRIVYNVSEETYSIYIHFIIHCKRNFKSFFYSYLKNNF